MSMLGHIPKVRGYGPPAHESAIATVTRNRGGVLACSCARNSLGSALILMMMIFFIVVAGAQPSSHWDRGTDRDSAPIGYGADSIQYAAHVNVSRVMELIKEGKLKLNPELYQKLSSMKEFHLLPEEFQVKEESLLGRGVLIIVTIAVSIILVIIILKKFGFSSIKYLVITGVIVFIIFVLSPSTADNQEVHDLLKDLNLTSSPLMYKYYNYFTLLSNINKQLQKITSPLVSGEINVYYEQFKLQLMLIKECTLRYLNGLHENYLQALLQYHQEHFIKKEVLLFRYILMKMEHFGDYEIITRLITTVIKPFFLVILSHLIHSTLYGSIYYMIIGIFKSSIYIFKYLMWYHFTHYQIGYVVMDMTIVDVILIIIFLAVMYICYYLSNGMQYKYRRSTQNDDFKVRIVNLDVLENEIIKLRNRLLELHEPSNALGVYQLFEDIVPGSAITLQNRQFNGTWLLDYIKRFRGFGQWEIVNQNAYNNAQNINVDEIYVCLTVGFLRKLKGCSREQVQAMLTEHIKSMKFEKSCGVVDIDNIINRIDKDDLRGRHVPITDVFNRDINEKLYLKWSLLPNYGLGPYTEIKDLIDNGVIEIGDNRNYICKNQRRPETTIFRRYDVQDDTWVFDRYGNFQLRPMRPIYWDVWLCESLISTTMSAYSRCNRKPNHEDICNEISKQTQFLMDDADWRNFNKYGKVITYDRIAKEFLETARFKAARIRQADLMVETALVETKMTLNRRLYYDIGRHFKYVMNYTRWTNLLNALFKVVISFTVLSLILWFLTTRMFGLSGILQPPQGIGVYADDEIYGGLTGYDKNVSKSQSKKKYKLLRQGYNSAPPSKHYREIYPGYNSDGLQWFDLRNQTNIDAAVTERVACSNITSLYQPDFKLMEKKSLELAKYIEKFKEHRTFDELWNLEAFEEYINSRPQYDKATKESIIREAEEWKNGDWLEALNSYRGRFEAFIKDEYYEENKRPRNILAASSLVKFYLGAVYHEIGEMLFNSDICIKEIPVDDRPSYVEGKLGGSGFIYQTDHTSFEAAATREIQEHTELIVYNYFYPELKDYFKFLTQDIIFNCGRKTDKCLPSTYFMPCSRWSGAPNTSLGNTILNAVLIEMISEKFETKMKYLVEGDDGLINSEKKLNVEDVKLYSLTQGFDLKMEEKESIGSAGFLSTVWESDLIPQYKDPWKYLISSITLRDYKVSTRKQYWDQMVSKLMSLAIGNTKHELLFELFKSAYNIRKNMFNESYLYYSTGSKLYYVEWLTSIGVEVEGIEKKSIVVKCNDSTIDKIQGHMHPEYYMEIYLRMGISEKLVEEILRKLRLNDYELFRECFREIIELYHMRLAVYSDHFGLGGRATSYI